MGETMIALCKLMEQDGSYMDQVLAEPSLEIAYKSNFSELRKYSSKHLPRLLKVAFRENNEEITLKALKLLTLGSQFIIPNLVKTSYFSEFVKKLISKGNLSNRAIGRICEITVSIFRSGYKDAINNCDYVIQLLNDHCDNLNVYSMFSVILSEKDKIEYHREWLFEIEFDKKLANMLQSSLKKNYSDTYSYDQEQIISLLRMVADAAKRSKIREKFLNGVVFDIFKQTYDLPPHLLNYYWEAINNLYDSNNSSLFHDHIESAKDIIISGNISRVYRYHAEALNFLSKVIDFKTKFVNEVFIKSIINIMILFNGSSDFLCESRNFFKKCLHVRDLQDIVISLVCPAMIIEADEKNHGLMPMFAFAIIADMVEIKENEKIIKKINGASSFIKKKIKPYIQKRDKSYGGDPKSQQQIFIQKSSIYDTPYPLSE